MTRRAIDLGPALFDLEDFFPTLDAADNVPALLAPIGFTTAYWPAADLLAAHEAAVKERGSLGSHVGAVHTWFAGHHDSGAIVPPGIIGHDMFVLDTSLSCFGTGHYARRIWHDDGAWELILPCQCVGHNVTLHRVQCEGCRWHFISDSEATAVEAWHDHAFPGWRDLPVVPYDIGPRGGGFGKDNPLDKVGAERGTEWVLANYPNDFKIPYAPVVTERAGIGTRHVPGYSPFGGYDLCARAGMELIGMEAAA